MFQHRELLYFLAVVDTGSVSGAARKCWVTQPAISRSLANSEREIGTRLFVRSIGGMSLTPAGEDFVPIARDLVERIERAERLAKSWTEGELSLRVVCPSLTAENLVSPFIIDGAPIDDILVTDPGEVYSHLRSGADLAISSSEPPPHLQKRHVWTTPIFAQSTVSHPGDQQTVELSDVSHDTLLVPGRASSVGQWIQSVEDSQRCFLPAVRFVRNRIVAQSLAAAGKGTAVVVEPPLPQLTSRAITMGGVTKIVKFYAVWDPQHYAAQRLGILADAFAEWLTGFQIHPYRDPQGAIDVTRSPLDHTPPTE